MTENPLKPSAALLCKLGSLAVHIDEMLSLAGHDFDLTTIKELLKDPEVKQWISQMDKLAMLPKKRNF